MGEYARLNKMLDAEEERYRELECKPNKSDEEYEAMADLYQSIGEIKGALLEMAEVDGLDDYWEAFDYYDEDAVDEYRHPIHGRIVDVRFDAYHDVTVYEDGFEERNYIGE